MLLARKPRVRPESSHHPHLSSLVIFLELKLMTEDFVHSMASLKCEQAINAFEAVSFVGIRRSPALEWKASNTLKSLKILKGIVKNYRIF